MDRLKDRVIIVTGGAHGIGQAYCEGLAEEGARVVVADIDASAAEDVAQNEDRPEPPRTSWGGPDLQGVWDYRTATPMERPRNYGDREFLTDEEAAAYEQQFSQRLDDSRRSPGTVADVERAYNEFWYDFGSNLTEDKRTSLIVDPPNGRIPPLTEEARLRATGPNESPLR